ncbi:MAG: dephospho-CoA kinase [Bacteroidales bacterium]|nr:dephospho-CoA kinase [Bacteroidales bacterium]
MLKVGLTGNIGSGKTLVANIFQKLGIPVFNADIEARQLYETKEVQLLIRETFGDHLFNQQGGLLRQKLAEIVFNDTDKLQELNGIIHPLVRNKYQEWNASYENQPYTIYEAAILFEGGFNKTMDKVICVTAPEELRIKRVMARDKVKASEVRRRMINQWPEKEKVRLADFVILNDGESMLIPQVLEVHKCLLRA